MSASSSRYLVPGVCAVVVILVALAVIQQMNQKEEMAVSVKGTGTVEVKDVEIMDTTPSVPAKDVITETKPTPSTETESVYKDGTYTATGNYMSPGGSETILVTLTLEDDKIASATVVPQATRPASVNWQGAFASGYQTLVLGKSLDEVSLSKVSGSSLTPKGFNDALSQIKVEAKS